MSGIEQRLQEVTELISLPEVYLKVRRLMDDPHSDIYDFAEVISVDPNLSSRVLKVVNSAYFGFPEPVDSISRAVNLIGIGQLHNMVLGISAISSLELPNDILPLDTFWRASLFSGVLARLLADLRRVLLVELTPTTFVNSHVLGVFAPGSKVFCRLPLVDRDFLAIFGVKGLDRSESGHGLCELPHFSCARVVLVLDSRSYLDYIFSVFDYGGEYDDEDDWNHHATRTPSIGEVCQSWEIFSSCDPLDRRRGL